MSSFWIMIIESVVFVVGLWGVVWGLAKILSKMNDKILPDEEDE